MKIDVNDDNRFLILRTTTRYLYFVQCIVHVRLEKVKQQNTEPQCQKKKKKNPKPPVFDQMAKPKAYPQQTNGKLLSYSRPAQAPPQIENSCQNPAP